MSTNGHLKFQGTNRATFVGATSNIMFDTTTTSLGIGVTGTDHPSSNLYITGNAYVSSNIAVGGVLTMGTVNVVARHDLESVTATGNTTPLTVEFQNADTSLVTTGNVEVGKELTVAGNTTVSSNLTVSGNVEVVKELTVAGNTTVSSNLTVSGNVEVGTANLFVDTVNSRVGIRTTSPEVPFSVIGNNALSGTPNNAIATFRATTTSPGTNDAGVVIGSINGNAPYIADVSTASLGLSFYTQSVQRMKILPGSNTGIEIYANGPVINCVNSNPGDMISKRYASADRYGMGQYTGGVTRLFTSTAYGPAKIALSGANDDVTDTNAGFNDYLTVENEGYIKYHNQPRFSAYSYSGNGTYSGFASPVALDRTYYNVGSHYNTSSGAFTAPVSGHYRFTIVLWNNTTGGVQGSLWYRTSSSGTWDDVSPHKLLGASAAGDETVMTLNSGASTHTFEVYVPSGYQIGFGGRGAQSVTVYRAHSYFSGELISIA